MTGALFLIEYFFTDAFRAVLLYDLALTPDQRVVGAAFTQDVVDSKVLLGLNWTPFRFDLAGGTRLELQGMALGGLVVTSSPPFIPGLLGRIHVSALQDGASGVGAYLGISYYARINTVGPVYGIGYRF